MPYQRDYSKEIDTIKTQLADLYAENAKLKLELNKLSKRFDTMNDTIEYLIKYLGTRVYQ
jgi:regulator of replication initiation timing